MYQVLSKLKEFTNTKLESTEPTEIIKVQLDVKILIAEDNPINMALSKIFIKEILPKAIILEAINGEEAVKMFQSAIPDLVLMDVQMPILNGLEATRKIRANEANIEVPIIALTAGSLPGEKEKCLEAGMTDFLTKPLLKQTLHNMLAKWLGIKTCSKEN